MKWEGGWVGEGAVEKQFASTRHKFILGCFVFCSRVGVVCDFQNHVFTTSTITGAATPFVPCAASVVSPSSGVAEG